jgi:hypothetical protein
MNQQIRENERFTDEQIEQFAGFAYKLKRIHERLMAEGYTIRNGQITPPKREMI